MSKIGMRGNVVLAGLLALSLVGAYVVTHPGKASTSGADDEAIRLWEFQPQRITRLTYREGAAETVLEPDWSGDAASPYVWVSTRSAQPVKPRPTPKVMPGQDPLVPEAHKEDAQKEPGKAEATQAAAATEAPQVDVRAFRGNKNALTSLEYFAKAGAKRALGELSATEAAAYGLPPQETHSLVVEREGADPLTLEIGRKTFGDGGYYVRSSRDGRVYLMRINEFKRLERAQTGLVDRELLGLQIDKAARLEAKVQSGAFQVRRMDGPNQWSDGSDAADEDPQRAQFAATLASLKATRYGAQDDAAAADLDQQPATLEVLIYAADITAPVDTVRIVRKGSTAHARSAYTRRWVEVPAQQVERLENFARRILQSS